MRDFSFRNNLFANYFGQVYVTLIGIAMLPMFIRYMGAEAYGLVGFFTMLQVWFLLLDLGLTPTVARQTACFNGGGVDALGLRRLLRTLESIFIFIALLGAAVVAVSADAIANRWLNVQQLSPVEVRHAIILMAGIVALRWTSGIYRGAINGFERLVWLNCFNAAIATARFVLVIPFFILVGVSPTEFFAFQLAVAAVELAVLVWKTYHLLPPVVKGARIAWEWGALQGVLKFSLAAAVTTSVWVMTTQLDKLILSKMLPLADYAYFTLAVLVANGILLITTPVSQALMPRLTKLSTEGDDAGLSSLYRNATQLVAVIAVPVSLILTLFAEKILWVWTGDPVIAAKAAPVLRLYALGYGIQALAAFPYYLQFAKGDLKLHLISNLLLVVVLVPTLTFAASRYGAIGAGYVWLCSNIFYFAFWVPLVHRRFVKGLHAVWLIQDVGAIVLWAMPGAALARWLISWPQERIPAALEIAAVSLGVLLAAAAGSSEFRKSLRSKALEWQESHGGHLGIARKSVRAIRQTAMKKEEGMQMLKKNIKVSVCVVSFNHERYIRRCLQSIVDQETDFDFEVIVGDDFSTDGTRLILREFEERYPGIVKPIYHERNLGPYKNYICTHSQAMGTYVAHCDGDDYWYPGKLKCQAEFLDGNQEVAAVFSNARSGKRIRNSRNECGLYRIEDVLEKVFTKNICVHSSIMERKAAVSEQENGLYDYELYWLKHGNAFIYIDPVALVHYSKNPDGLTRQKNFVSDLELTLQRLRERGLNDSTLERMHFDYALLKYFSHPLDMQRPSIGRAIRLRYSVEVLGRLIVPKNIFHVLKLIKRGRWKPEAGRLLPEIKF